MDILFWCDDNYREERHFLDLECEAPNNAVPFSLDASRVDGPNRTRHRADPAGTLKPRIDTRGISFRRNCKFNGIFTYAKRYMVRPLARDEAVKQLGRTIFERWRSAYFKSPCEYEDHDLKAELGGPTVKSVDAYMHSLTEAKAGGIHKYDDEPDSRDRTFYGFAKGFAKGVVKPGLQDIRKADQGVTYNTSTYTSRFGAAFGALAEEFTRRLLPNIFVDRGLGLDDLETLYQYFDFNSPALAFESDIEQYDCSQAAIFMEFERIAYEWLGMNPELLNEYMKDRQDWYLKIPSLGLRARMKYQRKSGEATTWFGNTIVCMAIITMLISTTRDTLMIFKGDDAFVFGTWSLIERNHVLFSDDMQMNVIFGRTAVFYFCSAIITRDGYILPDVIKLMAKMSAKRPTADVCKHMLEAHRDMAGRIRTENLALELADQLAEYYNLDASAALDCVRYFIRLTEAPEWFNFWAFQIGVIEKLKEAAASATDWERAAFLMGLAIPIPGASVAVMAIILGNRLLSRARRAAVGSYVVIHDDVVRRSYEASDDHITVEEVLRTMHSDASARWHATNPLDVARIDKRTADLCQCYMENLHEQGKKILVVKYQLQAPQGMLRLAAP